MKFCKLKKNELKPALELAWEVFLEFEAPEYSREGIEEFNRSIHDPQFLGALQCYGAFDDGEMIGLIATRSGGSHIALFFVDKRYHRQGIGRKLFELIIIDPTPAKITVNSSPYAVPIYRRLGFTATDTEQITNGIRYTPMEFHNSRR